MKRILISLAWIFVLTTLTATNGFAIDFGGIVNKLQKEVEKATAQPTNPTQTQQSRNPATAPNTATIQPKNKLEQKPTQNEVSDRTSSLTPTSGKFGFKEYTIGKKKTEIKNLGECSNKGGGNEVCSFAKTASTQIMPLGIFGIKTSIAGQDAIVEKVGFANGILFLVKLNVFIPNPYFIENQLTSIREALTNRYSKKDNDTWEDANKPTQTIHLAIGHNFVAGKSVREVDTIEIYFINEEEIEQAREAKKKMEDATKIEKKKKEAADL